MCGAFNAVLLQEASDHVQHISDQFHVYTDEDDLAILLNRDTFLPGAFKFPIIEETTSKTTWGLKALVVCGFLRRPPVGGPKSVTLCTVHLHNVVAKKRDAATSLGRICWWRLQQCCQRHHCRHFSATQNSWRRARYHSGGRVAQKEMTPTAQGSCIYPVANKQLGLNERDESTHYQVFMHLWATHLPGGTRVSLRSDAAQVRRNLRAAGKNVRKLQRRLFQAAQSKADPVTCTATAGKLQSAPPKRLRTASPTHPAYHGIFQ